MRVYSNTYPAKKVWWESILVFFIIHILRGKLVSYEKSEHVYKKFIYIHYKSHSRDCSYMNCSKYPNRKFKNCIEIFNGSINTEYELPFFLYKPVVDIYKGSYTDTDVDYVRYTYLVRHFGYTLTDICGDGEYYQSLHIYSNKIDERGNVEHKSFYKIFDFFWTANTLTNKFLVDLKGRIVYYCKIGKFATMESYEEEEKFINEQLEQLQLTVLDTYDNSMINCSVYRTILYYKRGNTPFTRFLMSLFTNTNYVHSIEVKFSEEVGRNKYSYKGGIVGSSFNLEENETFFEGLNRRLEKMGCIIQDTDLEKKLNA